MAETTRGGFFSTRARYNRIKLILVLLLIRPTIPKSYRINFPSSVTEILPGCGSA